MGTLLPSSTAEHEKSEKQNISLQIDEHQKDVDAGALFVLKSKGITPNLPFSSSLFCLVYRTLYSCVSCYCSIYHLVNSKAT